MSQKFSWEYLKKFCFEFDCFALHWYYTVAEANKDQPVLMAGLSLNN